MKYIGFGKVYSKPTGEVQEVVTSSDNSDLNCMVHVFAEQFIQLAKILERDGARSLIPLLKEKVHSWIEPYLCNVGLNIILFMCYKH